MDQTVEGMRAQIETLKAHVIKYRRLAIERRAADYLPIAEKLTAVAADCEARAAELEKLLAAQLHRATSS
jgi:hypothetical protein